MMNDPTKRIFFNFLHTFTIISETAFLLHEIIYAAVEYITTQNYKLCNDCLFFIIFKLLTALPFFMACIFTI